jgi:hypothetical protein
MQLSKSAPCACIYTLVGHQTLSVPFRWTEWTDRLFTVLALMSPFARNLLSHTSTILIPLLIHQYLALELPVDPGRPSCRTCFASSSFSPTESSRGSLNQRQICEFSSPAAGGFRRFRTLWPSSSFPDPSISSL